MMCNSTEQWGFYHYKIIGTGEITFIILILAGNMYVLLAMLKFSYLRIVKNYFLASLSCSNLLAAALLPIHTAAYFGPWLLRHLSYCKLRYACITLPCYLCLFNMAAIATERYIAISQPLAYDKLLTRR